MKQKPTIERLRELLEYDPETGALRWRVSRYRVRAGDLCCGLNGSGYIKVVVDQVAMRGHRVAWALHYGTWPQAYHRLANQRAQRLEAAP